MNSLKTGILFVNLGSPESPDVKDVKKYLNEFLMDKYVLDIPYFFRKIIVSGFILPFRPRRSSEAYKSIWWEDGSPLIVISHRFHQKISSQLPFPSALAMRYGNPSIKAGIQKLVDTYSVQHILLVPMYPHYAMSTTLTVVEKTKEIIRDEFPHLQLSVFPAFYNQKEYIHALSSLIKPYITQSYDYLLFSFHGIPERHLIKTDPTKSHCLKVKNCCEIPSPAHKTCYRYQAFTTTRLVAQKLGLSKNKYSVAFQSRLGKDSWLKPFTADEIKRLARSGIKKLLVVTPAFVVDCLETLEEMGIRGKELFIREGGKDFNLIPCLNDHDLWIEAMTKMIHRFINENF